MKLHLAIILAACGSLHAAGPLDAYKITWDTPSRSHVMINRGAGATDPGFLIGRNYQLFRYMLACNRDGELPLLFNGGIFTADNPPGRITGNNNDELPTSEGEPITPDFRRWMGCYFMSQNQRWLGWPTIANGDADLISPTVRFYRDRAGVAGARARTNGAEGVAYTESLNIWGLCPVAPRPDGLCGADHLTYHFSMGIEHAWMPVSIATGKPITASSTFDQPGYEAPKANDGDPKTRWASDFKARSGWLAIDLGEEKSISGVMISEIEWPETREFAIEVKDGENWKEVSRGTTIGAEKFIEFPVVRAREIRLNVFKAERPININEFRVFAP